MATPGKCAYCGSSSSEYVISGTSDMTGIGIRNGVCSSCLSTRWGAMQERMCPSCHKTVLLNFIVYHVNKYQAVCKTCASVRILTSGPIEIYSVKLIE